MKIKKAELDLSDLLSRQDYLVVQGKDLAKSFGGLKSFEQRILDYCFRLCCKVEKKRIAMWNLYLSRYS